MSEIDKTCDTTLDKDRKWDSMGLDPRIENAIIKIGWPQPTPVQAHSIPQVLEGS